MKVAGSDAVLGSGGSHTNDFLGTEVGREESEPGHPGGHGPTGGQKLRACPHEPLQDIADSQDEREVDDHNKKIDPLQLVGRIHGRRSLRGALPCPALRKRFGAIPRCWRNTVAKYWLDEKPHSNATSVTVFS